MSGPLDEPPLNGTTGAEIAFSVPIWMSIAAFTGVAWFNALQLNISIFMTFKKRRGLYFWSLLISSYGVVFHALGFLLRLFQITNPYASCTIITIGWWSMVTGQALVLYSRLHLVVKEQRILRAVLIMIIWNAITLHIPTTVFTYGSSSPNWRAFLQGFEYMERIQMTIFCVQEFIISGIYLWATARLLKPVYRRRTRSVMQQLIWINIIIVVMDISLLVMEYLGNYQIEATLKSMVYSIKLLLEFSVLNQLMRLANSNTAYNFTVRDEENEGSETRSHRHRKSLRYISRMLPQRASTLRDEKKSDEPSPHGATMEVPHGTPSSGSRKTSIQPWDQVNPLSNILTNDTTFSSSDRQRRASGRRPSLALETAINRPRNSCTTPTMINNPAAFVPERRPTRDPYCLDDLSPIAASPKTSVIPEPAFPSIVQRANSSRHQPQLSTNTTATRRTFQSDDVSPTTPVPLRPHTPLHRHSASTTSTCTTATPTPNAGRSSRNNRFSNILNLPGRLTSSSINVGNADAGQTSPGQISPPDPDLLVSRRLSVADWNGFRSGDDGTSSGSSEAQLEPADRAKAKDRPMDTDQSVREESDLADEEVFSDGDDTEREVERRM